MVAEKSLVLLIQAVVIVCQINLTSDVPIPPVDFGDDVHVIAPRFSIRESGSQNQEQAVATSLCK